MMLTSKKKSNLNLNVNKDADCHEFTRGLVKYRSNWLKKSDIARIN
jgi:hypothetical protein